MVRFLGVLTIGFIGGVIFIMAFLQTTKTPTTICKTIDVVTTTTNPNTSSNSDPTQTRTWLVQAILHYATSRATPQQTIHEIKLSMDVLLKLAPANLLVFGMGYDSLMWASFNLGGTTLFLEEDPNYFNSAMKANPNITARLVKYRTKLSEATELVQHFREEPDCSATKSFLRGNARCKLALHMLPDEVYDTEWDMIMIDGPKGYFPAAPGRMSTIYSAAVMARNRKRPGVTYVFLHDVNRAVEKVYSELFLCRKNMVSAAGNLWHFEIPSAPPQRNIDFC